MLACLWLFVSRGGVDVRGSHAETVEAFAEGDFIRGDNPVPRLFLVRELWPTGTSSEKSLGPRRMRY